MMKARLKLGLILLLVGCLLCVGLSTVSANDNNTTGDFTELNTLVQNNNVINLDTDYNATDKTFYKGITISNGMNVTINGNGHTIDGNYQGRIFDIKAGGTLTLNNVILINGKVSGNGASYGGAIYVNNGATLNINNCTFDNNQAEDDGGVIYNTGTLTINNSVFNNNTANYGGAISSKTPLTANNSLFNNNQAKLYGGAMYVVSQLYINNCTFNKNTVYKDDGGAVYCNDLNECNNCTFVNNFAGNMGGAIYIDEKKGINLIKDCTFNKNHANNGGGAIYLSKHKSHLSIIHNQFINNTVNNTYQKGYQNVYTSGYYSIIEFNYFPNQKQNMFIEGNIVEKNGKTSHIDSHAYYNLTDYYNHGKIFVGNFNELNYLVQNNNVINLDTDYNATDKTFYKGITISNGMNITINGNGHTIDGNYQGRIFDIKTGGTLTLNNVKLINGRVTYKGAVNGGAIYINKDATLNMNNCTFENNFASNNGGAIYSESNWNINNCTFIKNYANEDGGAIYVDSELNINNCTFNDNYAKNQGGAIKCDNINCNNSTFIRNHAEKEGGAIYAKNKEKYTSIIHNQFVNNTAGKGHGGFNVYNKGFYKNIEFNYFPNKEQNKFMENLVIFFLKDKNHYDSHPYYNLTDYYNHGKESIAVNVPIVTTSAVSKTSTGNFYELNTLIQNNNVLNLTKDYNATDKTFYKGITISNGMNITINGNGHIIDGNYQGRIFDIKKGGILTLNNVTLINGKVNFKAASYGGAIYINNGATLNINNCTFNNNQAEHDGGVIYNAGTLTINNSVFNNNIANYGGAICSDSKLNINNCTFNNNYAKISGGSIYLIDKNTDNKNIFLINNCTFWNNKADFEGGAICSYLELFSDNCIFIYNNAKYGGAIFCNKFIKCINCTFIYNNASYGGAINIGGKNDNLIIDSAFIENKAKENGGAICLDDYHTEISIKHNLFINNYAKNQGQNVYNAGYYDIIEFNYFPNKKQNKFTEQHVLGSNKIHIDSHAYYNLTDYYNHGKESIAVNVPIVTTSAVSKTSTGNFYELNTLIQNNNVINLDTDYNATDKTFYKGITISNGMNVTINGNGHTIDGNYQGRIFDIKAGGTLTLNNVKLINGKVSDNGAVNGGAIYINKDATLNMNNCTFENNYASSDGGAIYSKSTLNINNCTFIKNSANEDGGAISCTFKLNINNCTFNDNCAKEQGGAIKCYITSPTHYDSVKCYNSTFIRNHAEKEGGAIYVGNNNMYSFFIHNIFINNTAGEGHGGFNVYNEGYYDVIEFNYFPNEEQDKFMEKKYFKGDTNYHDLHPYYNLTDYYNHGKTTTSVEEVPIVNTAASSVEENNTSSGGAIENNGTVNFNSSEKIQFYNETSEDNTQLEEEESPFIRLTTLRFVTTNMNLFRVVTVNMNTVSDNVTFNDEPVITTTTASPILKKETNGTSEEELDELREFYEKMNEHTKYIKELSDNLSSSAEDNTNDTSVSPMTTTLREEPDIITTTSTTNHVNLRK